MPANTICLCLDHLLLVPSSVFVTDISSSRGPTGRYYASSAGVDIVSLPAIHSPSTLVLRRPRAYISHHSAPYPTNLYEDVIILCHGPLTTHQRLLPAPAYCSLPFPLIVSTTFYLDFSRECGCRLSTYDGREFPLYQNSPACTIHEGSGHIGTVAVVLATVWMGHWAERCVVTCSLPL